MTAKRKPCSRSAKGQRLRLGGSSEEEESQPSSRGAHSRRDPASSPRESFDLRRHCPCCRTARTRSPDRESSVWILWSALAAHSWRRRRNQTARRLSHGTAI